MSYAQKRRSLGQFTVGWLLLCTAVCYSQRWGLYLSGTNAAQLTVAYGVYAFLLFPSDLLGWHIDHQCCPRRFCNWASAWLEGVLVQGVVMVTSGCLILEAGKSGIASAGLCITMIMLALVCLQETLARFIGCSQRSAFYTGGVVGLPGFDRVVPDQPGSLVTMRRRLAVKTGLRRRGLLWAMAWNLIGFCLSARFPAAGVASAAELVHLSCVFTLWCFAGLILLPRIHHRAVRYLDRKCLSLGFTAQDFERHLSGQDEWRRAELTETIFHPIPSPANRFNWLNDVEPSPPRPWHVLRTALFLSWGCLGWLSRAVHCNCGRPEVWVLLPCD